MKKRFALLMLSFVLCITSVACSSGKNTEKTGDEKAITVAIASDINDINVHLYDGNMTAQGMVYESLVVDGKDGIEPGLAKSWKISEDGKEYTFNLRKGVKFHDGEEFNAEAVKLNIDAVQDNKERHSWMALANKIKEVKVVDDYTVKLVLSEAYYPTLEELGLTRPYRMTSPKDFKNGGTKDGVKGYNGTGPYKLVSQKEGQSAVFEANKDYWGGAPDIKKVTFKVMPTGQTTLLALKKGEIDFTSTDMLDADAIKELKSDDKFQVVKSEPVATKMLLCNTADKNSLMSSKDIRNAVWYSIDRKTIADKIMSGTETEADRLFSTNTPYSDINLEKKSYDVKKAEELLDKAGWKLKDGDTYRTKDGKTLELDLLYFSDKSSQKPTSEYIQSNLKEVGIKCNLVGEKSDSIYDTRDTGKFDLLFDNTWGMPYDPQSSLSAYETSYKHDFNGLDNKDEITKKIDKVLVTTDEKERQDLYTDILTEIHNQAAFIPLTNMSTTVVANKNISGITFNQSQYEMPFEKMKLK